MNADSESVADAVVESSTFDFEAVFHRHYTRIARVIAQIVRDPTRAEDVTVEVFWKLLRTPRVRGPGVNGWLYRTAVRMSLDELRKQRRREKYERLTGFGRATPTPEELHSEKQEQEGLRRVLAAIKPRQAEMLILRGEGLSYEEIAQALKLNPGSVGTLLSRAQEAFRKEYINRYGNQG